MGKLKWGILLGVNLLTALALAALISLYYLAPEFVEGFLKSQAKGMGLKNPRLSVSSLSFLRLEMGRLSVGPEESPALEIAHLSASYDPASLRLKKLKEIAVTGLKAHVRWDGKNLFVEGLQDLTVQAGEERDGVPPTAEFFRQLGKIRIHAASLTMHISGQEIPLLIEGAMAAESSSLLRFSFSAVVAGSSMTLEGKVDFATGEGEVEIAAAPFQGGGMDSVKGAERFPNFFLSGGKFVVRGRYQWKTETGSLEIALPHFQGKVFHGTAASAYPDITAAGSLHAVITLQERRMEKTEMTLNLETLCLEKGALSVTGKGTVNLAVSNDYRLRDIQAKMDLSEVLFHNTSVTTPLLVRLSGETMKNLSFSIEPFQSLHPYPTAFSQVSGKILNLPHDPQIRGQFSASVDNRLFSSLFPEGRLKVKSPYSLAGNYFLGHAQEGWKWRCDIRGDQAWGLAYGKREVAMDKTGVTMALEGTTTRASGLGDLALVQVVSRGEDFALTAKKISVKNRLNFSVEDGLSLESDLNLHGADFSLAGLGDVVEMDICWPLAFPPAKGMKKGRYAVRSITAKDQTLLDIKGSLEQRVQELKPGESLKIMDRLSDSRVLFHLTGEARYLMGPRVGEGITLRYAGDGHWGRGDQELNLHLEFPKSRFTEATSLGPLHPTLQGWKFIGGIAAGGDITWFNGNLKGDGRIELEGAELHSEKPKISVTGIESILEWEDLLRMTTLPAQRLQFEKLTWGEIPFTKGELRFRLEGSRSLFLEKGEFIWCGGKIYVNAVRFDLDKDDVTLLLYCDKVNLSRMLNFMVQDISAEGTGRISGIIPLQISKGKVTFKEGFLYSTPGDTGMIRIKETDVISGGNVLLEEAIKDFSYDWVKVRLDSRGENLNMVVNLNGTPNRKLPLVLDPDTKSFKRDEKGEAGVNLQGLHLELKFNEIPLDELLRKGKYLKGLMQ